MQKRGQSIFDVIKQTFKEFTEDDCPRMAAALSYYTIFSLPPLLFLIIMIAGFVFSASAAQDALTSEIEGVVGTDTAAQIGTMVSSASERATSDSGLIMTILGGLAFVFGATGAFAQLQAALNRAWEVAPDPEKGGILNFVFKRFLSFGMILATGFLLLVSLALSAAVSAIGSSMEEYLPTGIGPWVPRTLDFIVSLTLITLLFAAIFKFLPDAIIRWREVWTGAFVTAVLFVVGKFGIGFYLGKSNPGSAYGAAGSLAVILLWMYLSAMILLIGAEFTQVWARRLGKRIEPSKGAVRMVRSTAAEIRRDDGIAASEKQKSP
jgi:membrane protein